MSCLALHRDGYTREQVQRSEERRNLISAFLETKPTPDQFSSFMEKLPPIADGANGNKTPSESDIVNSDSRTLPSGDGREYQLQVTDCVRERSDILLRFDVIRTGKFDGITIKPIASYAIDEHGRRISGTSAWIDGGSSGSLATRRQIAPYAPVQAYVRFKTSDVNALLLKEVGISTTVGSFGQKVLLNNVPIR